MRLDLLSTLQRSVFPMLDPGRYSCIAANGISCRRLLGWLLQRPCVLFHVQSIRHHAVYPDLTPIVGIGLYATPLLLKGTNVGLLNRNHRALNDPHISDRGPAADETYVLPIDQVLLRIDYHLTRRVPRSSYRPSGRHSSLKPSGTCGRFRARASDQQHEQDQVNQAHSPVHCEPSTIRLDSGKYVNLEGWNEHRRRLQ
jgi:hypothetical protein